MCYITTMSSELYAILRRPYQADYESARWEIVKYSKSLQNAKRMASGISGNHGDIIAVVSVDHITDIANNTLRLCVVRSSGRTQMCDVPQNLSDYKLFMDIRRGNVAPAKDRNKPYTWISVWDGIDADPVRMIEMSEKFDRATIAETAREMFAAPLPHFDKMYNDMQVRALDTFDGWMRGEIDSANVARISNRYSDEASLSLLGIAFQLNYIYSAKNSAYNSVNIASRSSGRLYYHVADEFAAIVRRHIPLPDVMLKSIGDALPII